MIYPRTRRKQAMIRNGGSLAAGLLAVAIMPAAMAQEGQQGQGGDVDTAREVLQQRDTDVTQESSLEEVFQAAEKQYSLLPSGQMALNFSGDYTYFRSDRIDIDVGDSGIRRFRILNEAQHTFGASLSFDYGIWDNLTFNTRVPAQYRYDTQRDAEVTTLGDITFGLRYQPFPVRRGGVNTTLFTTLSTATGDSPFEIDDRREVAGGKGYYSLGGGVSMSKVLDPVVLFGSLGYTMGFEVSDLSQNRGDATLTALEPGDSASFSAGLAYSLSYEVSVSASYQQSYNFSSYFVLETRDEDNQPVTVRRASQDSTSSVLNFGLGLRTSANRIINYSFGFGLTEDSPDVILGVSLPIDISGLRPGA